jgi:Rps23 Pro-64 3,4-dihydroxylase Tpa1-like proline 4-hydroxylase/peroxiredoxin/GT2 family glycosyltransferase
MHYSIWIVDSWPDVKGPGAKGHTRCFEEVALALQSAFHVLGHEATIVDKLDKAKGRVIALGAGVLDRHKNISLPQDMIIYNFEQVHEQARFFLSNHPYVNFLRRFAVWDYSRNNIAELARRGITDVTMCGVGYMPELTRIAKADYEDIDVLFIGSMHERRQHIIDELKQRGLRVEVIQDMYGKARDDMIARSKVILNVHLQPANVFEIVRVSYMLANSKCVVSEVGDDKQLEGPFDKAVVFRPYDELVSACLQYVSNATLRTKQEAEALAVFSQYSQVTMLEGALKKDELTPDVDVTMPVIEAEEEEGAEKPLHKRRIFVNLASFRDPEINATVQAMFSQAEYPDRVFAGVCLQIDEKQDRHCTINIRRPRQMRIKQYSHTESKGANWARAQAQSLWQGEEYVLQIDSHMRFAKGWDSKLIDMLESCPSDKPVISTYVPRYVPPDTLMHPEGHLMRIRLMGFVNDGRPQLMHLSKIPVPVTEKERMGLYPSPFYIANFMFCRAQTTQELPFDPYIKFWGDEMTYSARLWTHGYDVFQTSENVIWHYWRRDELARIQPYRRIDSPESRQAAIRIKHLLGFEHSNDTMDVAAALKDFDHYGLGSERELDDLWEFAGVDWHNRTITEMGLRGKWNMAARDKAKQKAATKKTASMKADVAPKKTAAKKTTAAEKKAPVKKTAAKVTTKTPAKTPVNKTKTTATRQVDVALDSARIFVQIPSYRDPDCHHTIKDLYEKAAHPERIFVGVCWQSVSGEDDHCFETTYPYEHQVRVREFEAEESKGVCWARNITQSLWDGEEFTLGIDSHMRFEQGWDDELLSMWTQCHNEKAVLTTYPPAPDAMDSDPVDVHSLVAHEFDSEGIFLMKAWNMPIGKYAMKEPVPGAFIGACMIFGPSKMIEDVPYDPNIYFFGEEISMAVRLWTHGYDIYHPQKTVMYHNWEREGRPTHFQDHPNWRGMNKRAGARVRHLLGAERSKNKLVIQDIDTYGLGTTRSLKEYQDYSGVDFAKKTISKKAQTGEFGDHKWPKLSGNAVQISSPLHMHMLDYVKQEEAKVDTSKLPRIFVQIPSYRDPDCQNTIKDMFEKAKYPERVFAGVCWQYVKGDDDHCFEIPYPYPDQVRVHEVDAYKSTGVCMARSITQSLWRGEEFTLGIDAHTRFEPGWDEIVLEVWKSCDNPKAVLSVYPPAFERPDICHRGAVHGMGAREFTPDRILIFEGKPGYGIDKLPKKPMPGVFSGACMIFGPSKMIEDVPYDPNIYFIGEEITMSVRLWTHGYDIYHPNKLILYHDYVSKVEERTDRKFHFHDNKSYLDKQNLSYMRIRHLLGTEPCDNAEALKDLEKYSFGNERTLQQYQEYSQVDFFRQTIGPRAKKGVFPKYGELLPEEKTAAQGGTHVVSAASTVIEHDKQEEDTPVDDSLPLHLRPFKITRPGAIFINIASYRDPECQWTVKDLFEKANNPDRIFVGICWQFDEKEDQHCFEVVTRPDQVRILPVDWRDAEGVCWARYQTQQLWDGEEYNLMIDSHMRFVPGWDDLMINELAACDSPKPFLSCSPAAYTPPNQLSTHIRPTVRRVKPFMADGNLRCQGEPLDRKPHKPLNGAFMVANFAFSRAEVLKEVPYDPFLYFDQEEISYAARLYTHGWDVFSARDQFLYHYYNTVKAPGGSVRPLHWRDLHKEDNKRIQYLRERGLKRFNHMTRYQESTDQDVTQLLNEFGWGTVRSLDEYEAYSGVDFKNKVCSERALRCWFIQDLAKYRDRPIFVPELDNQKKADMQISGQQVARGGGQSMQQVGLKAPKSGTFRATDVQMPSDNQDNKPQDNARNNQTKVISLQPQKAQQQTPPSDASKAPPKESLKELPTKETMRYRDAPRVMLEQGDFMPLFQLMDTNKRLFSIERLGGRFILCYFLPADDVGFLETFFRHLQQQLNSTKIGNATWQTFVLDCSVERIVELKEKLRVPHTLMSDGDGRLAMSLGIIARKEQPLTPTCFVLNTNLKIVSRHQDNSPELATMSVRDCYEQMKRYNDAHQAPQVFSEMSPALIVPNAFTDEFCEKAIRSFRTGHTFNGTVGSDKSKAYRPEAKVRIDHIPGKALCAELDDKLSRSLFPEIKKFYGFDVRFREQYKVGLYPGGEDKQGFFVAHRDNFDSPLGYRRLAMTLNLTDEFEGGGLRFPEYGNTVFRPAKGSAIVFPCAMMHEALKVTKGERIILVGFFHGEEEERFRHYYAQQKSKPIRQNDFIPTLRTHPHISQSRDFFNKWKEETVDYDKLLRVSPYGDFDVRTPGNRDKRQLPTTIGHNPIKVFESNAGLVMDNFLPEDAYERLLHYVQRLDYKYINTNKISRAWHIHDGFPLRSEMNAFYYPDEKEKPKDIMAYPTYTLMDSFFNQTIAVENHNRHIIGEPKKDWQHMSATVWLYPHGTGLSAHDDGAGVYSGAYVYFLNPVWKPHWGGQLLLLDEQANQRIKQYKAQGDSSEIYHGNWLHANRIDELLMEEGFAQCIFPKRNRIVFIANDAYHMVTRVNEQSGDNARMSVAGFFVKKKK